MKAAKQILRHKGYTGAEDLEIGEEITVHVRNYTDLTIEKIRENRVSVAHYYTQNGDLMADPEIVFKICKKGEWIPIRYTQHPTIHHYSEDGLPRVKKFAKIWSRNLKREGHVEAAKQETTNQ